MTDQRAIIDIGSNTVRLVIYNGPPRAPIVLLNEKVTPRLGKDVAVDGRLSDNAMELALAALSRFALLLRMREISDIQTVATAAVRDASNRAEFLAAVERLGLAPRVLSGEEEAQASAMGVIAAFPGTKGVVGDLGGGSLELLAFDGGNCDPGITLPFGTLKLPALREDGAERFAERVRKGLKHANWKAGAGLPLFIVGGSWRALALHCMQQTGWPLDDPHDFELAPDEALDLFAPLALGEVDGTDPRISSSRRATLPDAAALLGLLVDRLEPSRIVFSSWGLREGLLYSRLDKKTRAQDPMLSGVAAFAADARVSFVTAERVTRWTSAISYEDDDQANGNLRLAGTMLALASLRSEPNLRADQAIAWALRKRWIGLNARGRAMLAMTVFANTGHTDIPEALAPLTSESDFKQAIAWGLGVRLCQKLTGTAEQALEQTALIRDDTRLILELEEPMQALTSNSVAKNLRNLAEWLGLEWSIDFLAKGQKVG
ncbi:MAG: Ppx/GppA family phosphatase [Novosphingobium sp.]|nr:Ppx/GppA family phosphatase [Novosphingobium sp.]